MFYINVMNCMMDDYGLKDYYTPKEQRDMKIGHKMA